MKIAQELAIKVYKQKLQELHDSKDVEATHSEANELLCDLLVMLGYGDVVKEYRKLVRWYA